jgi:hypothetical protein
MIRMQLDGVYENGQRNEDEGQCFVFVTLVTRVRLRKEGEKNGIHPGDKQLKLRKKS